METYNDIYPPFSTESLALVPEEMKKEKRWVCWGGEKIPVSVLPSSNGKHFGIDITKPENWSTFDKAVAAIGQSCFIKSSGEKFHVTGIGFVVGDGWFCADMDGGKKHKKEDVPKAAISDALRILDTYAETSLSGCGYHIFGKCDFSSTDAERNKPHRGPDGLPVSDSYEIEFFTRRKFIVITSLRVSGSSKSAKNCTATALEFYDKYILNDWKKDEQRRQAERAKVSSNIPIDADAATKMFLLNYPEILAFSDSSNFKRGGRGVKLAPGEYSWIGALKAMQEIGIPERAIMDWCKRGSNFKSEEDVRKVLNQRSGPRKASVAGIIEDAKAHGWKPSPEKLTGQYKEKYESLHNDHLMDWDAKLAELGFITDNMDQYDWSFDFDWNIDIVRDKKTGEVLYTALNSGDGQQIEELSVITTPNVQNLEKNRDQSSLVGYDDVEIKPIDYIFFPWFPRGYITTIQGDSGASKSSFMYAIGAKVSAGCDLLGIPCEDPGNVLFITTEDDPGDIKTSFMDARGDLSHLFRIENREEIAKLDLSPEGAKKLDRYIKEKNIKLLVLDPIQQFLSCDMNKASETRPQMMKLEIIASENKMCIVIIQHMGKDTMRSAQHRSLGSVDINASCRSQLQVVTDPEDPNYKIAYTVKSNLAPKHDVQLALRYQVKDHPNSYDPVTNKRLHFRGHVEFCELIPEYNDDLFRKTTRKAEEDKIEEMDLQFEYDMDPIVITARELISYNPDGLFIGTDDLIQKITEAHGSCPYIQAKNKNTSIYERVDKLRSLMMDKDGIQFDRIENPIKPSPFNWRSEIFTPDNRKKRGFRISPIKNGTSGKGKQQIKF